MTRKEQKELATIWRQAIYEVVHEWTQETMAYDDGYDPESLKVSVKMQSNGRHIFMVSAKVREAK